MISNHITPTHEKRHTRLSISASAMPPLPFSCHRRSRSSGILSSSSSLDGRNGGSGLRPTSQSCSLLRRNTTSPSLGCTGNLNINASPITHHVSFNFHGDANNGQQRVAEGEEEVKTKVINLPWTDARGSLAAYTGEVSELIQPHGFGFLVYHDGTVFSSIWCNGMPLRPEEQKGIEEQLHLANSMPRLLDLGDIARPSEMQHPSHDSAFEETCFPIHSFAFVLRSSGQWTYAIVANRPVINGPGASIRFVVDKHGSTKILERKHWARYIRLVRDHEHSETVEDNGVHHREMMMNQGRLDRHVSFHRDVSQVVTTNMSVRTDKKRHS